MAKNVRDGKSLYLEFDGVQIEIDYRDFNDNMTEVSVDATAGDDELTSTHKIRETCVPTFSILVVNDAAGNAIYNKLKHGATGNLVWGKNGSTTGEPKWGIEARLVVMEPLNFGAERVLDVTAENIGRGWLFDGRSDTF